MNIISKKKPFFAIKSFLYDYLAKYERISHLPLQYSDLLRYTDAFPFIDKKGNDTLWESVVYPPYLMQELNTQLIEIYSLLKTGGDVSVIEHLYIDRIDYCTFGNSNPFRIRVMNHFNDNYDYFYVKKGDASRIYGLELEHILSPNRINYFVYDQTLIEEHIAGIPGDEFIKSGLDRPSLNKVRIAKEFVKFNERCFVRLLGDMRAYNYVIVITPDFEEEQYRVRAIDFDQQCYEGKKNNYLPQFFKDNNAVVALCTNKLAPETVRQYQFEERTLMGRRYKAAHERISDLMQSIEQDDISTPKKFAQLRSELATHHQKSEFKKATSMGILLHLHLEAMLVK